MNDLSSIPQTSAPSPATVFEAIVKLQALSATYNRGAVTLAPHVVYTKHDELYVDAVTLERDGKPPKEVKIGSFKLSGLRALRITPRRFEKSEAYVATEPRYRNALIAVE